MLHGEPSDAPRTAKRKGREAPVPRGVPGAGCVDASNPDVRRWTIQTIQDGITVSRTLSAHIDILTSLNARLLRAGVNVRDDSDALGAAKMAVKKAVRELREREKAIRAKEGNLPADVLQASHAFAVTLLEALKEAIRAKKSRFPKGVHWGGVAMLCTELARAIDVKNDNLPADVLQESIATIRAALEKTKRADVLERDAAAIRAALEKAIRAEEGNSPAGGLLERVGAIRAALEVQLAALEALCAGARANEGRKTRDLVYGLLCSYHLKPAQVRRFVEAHRDRWTTDTVKPATLRQRHRRARKA